MVVPSGHDAKSFQPDSFMVARAIRPKGIFCYHSALQLLGAAHSVWSQCTLFTNRRRPPLALNAAAIQFLKHPAPFLDASHELLGTRNVERRGELLRTTGPERTLVEGFRRPDLVGGLPELTIAAAGFPTLDLDLLAEVLERYSIRYLWAAVGWFLEQHQKAFHVSNEYLARVEKHRPRSPEYLVRDRRGGAMAPRWNIILPPELEQRSEP